MNYGLYLSAQGAQLQSTRLDVVANNLANASTGAFKRDLAVFQAHHPHDVENGTARELPGGLNESTGGLSLAAVATDFSDGPTVATGGTFDVALAGPGFLRVSDGREELLTRNGRLTVDSVNQLVTADSGHPVLAAGGGRITIPPDAKGIEFSADGAIHRVDADGNRSTLGRLDLVQPDSYSDLEKVGNSFYRAAGKLHPADDSLEVRQGFLENSGTRPVLEMLELIQASRAFETNVNMIRFQDEALAELLQSAAR